MIVQSVPAAVVADAFANGLPRRLLGVPVVFRQYHLWERYFSIYPVCYAAGIWPFKRVVVCPMFFALVPAQRFAVLMHEVGHVKLRHFEKRLLAVWSRGIVEFCRRQEFEADAFAAAHGQRDALIAFLSRGSVHEPASMLHPAPMERIKRLMGE